MKLKHVFRILTLVLFSHFAQANSNSIEPSNVLQLIETKQAPLILDVRTPQEFYRGHIPGAINIAYQSLADSNQLNAYKEKDIIIYCHSGRRAQIAEKILENKGFKRLIDLRGSLLAWQQLNYPLAMF